MTSSPNARSTTDHGTFGEELRAAVTPRTLLLVLGVLLLQLGFVVSYLHAFHAPTPRRIPIAVAAPQQVSTQLVAQLNALPGQPLDARPNGDAATAERAVLRREVDAALVVSPSGTTDRLLVASAAGPALTQATATVLQRAEAAQQRQLEVVDLRPPSANDSRSLSSFYLVIGWMIGGYLAASILGVATGSRPANRYRAVIRLGSLALYAVASGLGGALIADPLLDTLPGHFGSLWAVGALVVLAAAAATTALQSLLGIAGIGAAIGLFVVLGNPSAGGPYPGPLLPGFWRAIGPLLPPGAGTTAVRNVMYFDGYAAGRALWTLAAYAVIGAAVCIAVSGRRPRATGRSDAGSGAHRGLPTDRPAQGAAR